MAADTGGEPATRRAAEIAVRQGRLLLFWPLALRLTAPACCADDVAKAVSALAERLERAGGPWTRVRDPIEHIAPPPDGIQRTRWENDAYAEAVYFHEFVQSFLFRKQTGTKTPPFYLFRRTDVCFAEVTCAGTPRTLIVERLNLYLFRTGAAILVLELATQPDGWSLAAFQDVHDHFRRVYAPFFTSSDSASRGPCFKAPERVAWQDKNGEVLSQLTASGASERGEWKNVASLADVDRLVNHPDADGCRPPPVFGHWRFLIAGALPLAGEDAPNGEGRWQQIVDDRMPSMATLSVDDLKVVREGDLIRLCFADDKGDDPYPYDEEFLLKEFWTKNAYTRFRSMGTLFLSSGYAFVAIGAGWFFDNIIMPHHVRRHYFQMGLLAHFEMASLLSFSSQISDAVRRLDQSRNQAAFQAEMAAIEEQFLQFVHRFRFTGVSNQLQAQEMFDMWRDRLQVDKVFKDVQTEIHTANTFLSSRSQTRTSSAATTLSQVATLGVVLGLAFGMLGMNVVIGGGQNPAKDFAILFGSVGAFMLIGGVFLQLLTPEGLRDGWWLWPLRPLEAVRDFLQSPKWAQSWLQNLRSNESDHGRHPLASLLVVLGWVAALVAFILAVQSLPW